MGFCVAIAMKGGASWYETPSTVTWFSCMHSRRAACVFGEARLISSTRSRLVKTGPGRNSNSFVRWSKTFTPVTSDGSRSGVNWSREKEQSSERASALASIVFPTPGKSSMIKCPSATRQRTQRRSVSAGARTTRATFSATRSSTSAGDATGSSCLPGCASIAPQEFRHRVQDRSRDLGLRRLWQLTLGAGRDEDDLVLGRLEADVLAADV